MTGILEGLKALYGDWKQNSAMLAEQTRIGRGDYDDTHVGPLTFMHEGRPYRPTGQEYRVMRYPNGRLGLECLNGEKWAEVEAFLDRADTDGVEPAHWHPLSRMHWSDSSLRRIAAAGLNRPMPAEQVGPAISRAG